MGAALEVLTSLPKAKRHALIDALTPSQQLDLWYDWRTTWARPEQLPPPGVWAIALKLAGRGWGKTRSGAEFIRDRVETGKMRRGALVAPTAADARDVMVEGDSGILAVSPPWNRPRYEPSKRRLTWPNGSTATLFSAEEPNRLRGPQYDTAWADEIATWKHPEAWDNLMFGLRLGDDPRAFVTTTPRPMRLVRDLVKDTSGRVSVQGGSTYENSANLAGQFLEMLRAKYEGTSLGAQEIYAVLLEEAEGALWRRAWFEPYRRDLAAVPALTKIVVAIDPAVTTSADADATGIVVAGRGIDGHIYVLADYTMAGASPAEWAERALWAYHREWQADEIVGEVNNGGDLVETVIRAVERDVFTKWGHAYIEAPYRPVHASRGKRTRAQPVAALYQQGRVHHVRTGRLHPDWRAMAETGQGPVPEMTLTDLEDQLANWTEDSDDSPDRMDALVWAVTALEVEGAPVIMIREWADEEEPYVISPLT